MVCLVKFVLSRLSLMLIYCQAIDSCDDKENLSSKPKRKGSTKPVSRWRLFLEQGSNWKPSSFVEESLSKNIRFDDDVEHNKKKIYTWLNNRNLKRKILVSSST